MTETALPQGTTLRKHSTATEGPHSEGRHSPASGCLTMRKTRSALEEPQPEGSQRAGQNSAGFSRARQLQHRGAIGGRDSQLQAKVYGHYSEGKSHRCVVLPSPPVYKPLVPPGASICHLRH